MTVSRLQIGLRAALALRVLVPLCIVLGAAVAVAVTALEAEIERRMKDDVELVARALRLPLIHAMARDRGGSVREALRSALRIERVYGAYVYGPDGGLMASHGSAVPDRPPDRLGELVEVGARVGEFGSVGGRRVYSSFVPLTDEWGRSLGLLQVVRRQRDFDRYVASLRRGALVALVVGLGIVTVLLLHGHHRAAIAPLHQLSDSMARVGTGDTDHRAATNGPRELAKVAVMFNEMLDGLQSAATELEERRAAQDAMQRELALTARLAAVGELSAGVAHELGTPLSIVEGHAQRMLRRGDLAPGTSEALAAVRAQVARMEEIVRQLLEFGRAETGRRRLVDLGGLVRGAATAVADAARNLDVRIELSPPRSPVSVEVDARRVEESIRHLLGNALQAAPGGRVRVGWSVAGADVALDVDDDGPGVPVAARARVFEPFYTTKGVGEGSGLGLAVVHGVVEEHGGRIVVGHSPLGGARFAVRLPAAAGCGSEGEGR